MKNRILTVYKVYLNSNKPTSSIRLQGKWLEKLGFGANEKVTVETKKNVLIIKKADIKPF